MATKCLMQAQDMSSLALVTWLSALPDWDAVDAPAGGYLTDSITLAGGGLESESVTPDGALTFDDGSFVVFDDGSFAVTS